MLFAAKMGAADPTPVAETAIAMDDADKKSLLSMTCPYSFRILQFPEFWRVCEAFNAVLGRKEVRKRAAMKSCGALPKLSNS
jgi:hypothetical protein